MRNRFTLGLTMACAAAALASADANTPKNALGAIAVSPDGATLVAAGDNRVLYVLDPASLEVKQRVAIGVNPYAAYFSADGKTLAIHDTDGAVTLFNAADWSVKTKNEGGDVMVVSAAADTYITLSYPQSKDGAYATPFTIYSLADGSKKGEGTIGGQIKSIVATPDGSAYAGLTDRIEDATETKQSAPADLKDLAKDEFELKNDGYTAELVVFDATGKEISRTKTWYATYDSLAGSFDGTTAYFLGYSNKNLKISTDGTASLFTLEPSYLYGMGVSGDGKTVAAGSLRDGTRYTLADGTAANYELDQQEGWPEYFEGFGFAPDGSFYGGTTAFRLAHIGADGTIQTVKPIY